MADPTPPSSPPPALPPAPPRRSLAAARRYGWIGVLAGGIVIGVLLTLVLQLFGADEDALPLIQPGVEDRSPDVTVVLSPGLLTALIRQSLAGADLPLTLENVRVETEAGKLIVLGNTSVLGRKVGGQIDMFPTITDGALDLEVTRARIAGLNLPNRFDQYIERPINERVTAALGGLPATLTGITADEDGITVTARVRVDELSTLPP